MLRVDTTVDRVFAVCLLGGFAAAVLLVLSAGLWTRLRLPRVRLPHLFHLHEPHVHVARPRARVPHADGVLPLHAVDATLFPPGTVPIFLAVFVTLFGAGGLLCRNSLHLPAALSLPLALIGGLIVTALVAFALWRYFLSGAQASEVRGETPLGKPGHVSITIPADGVGAIAFVTEGHRVTMPARCKTARELPQLTDIIILDVVGHTAVVEEPSAILADGR